jgi:hypothetical protein
MPFQTQFTEDRLPVGVAGQVLYPHRARFATYVNKAPQAAQVATITVDSHVASEELTVTINGVAISVTNPGSAGSTSTSATALAAAINAELRVSGAVVAVAATADVVITSRWPGVGFTITEGETNLSLAATTANAAAAAVPFGRAVVGDGVTDTIHQRPATLPSASSLGLMVKTATPVIQTGNVSETASLGVRIRSTGATYWGHAPTASATTVQALVELLTPALNSVLPANTVVATEDNLKVTLTAEVPGLAFDVLVGDGADADSTWAVADVTVGSTTDINRAFRGVAAASRVVAIGSAEWPANSAMEILEADDILVVPEEAVAPGDPVYVGVGSTHEGKWRKSASGANYVALAPELASWAGTDAGFTVLRVKAAA